MRISPMFSALCDLLIPPRDSELLVRQVSLDTVRELRDMRNGSLPYHDETTRALVWEVKYHANRRAAQLCGILLAELLMELRAEELTTPLLLPVPMHDTRRRKRGHNQTELLCVHAMKHLSILYEYAPTYLKRTLDTRPQQGLTERERRVNVKDSMSANAQVAGRMCVVLDDVSTTGATFAEAERALRAAGATVVIAVALARP